MSNTLPKIQAVLFDLDDTINDRCASWTTFIPMLRRKYAQHIGSCDDRVILRAILAADRGGYRPKDELFSELRAQPFWINAPTVIELESFWRETFATCMVERAGARRILNDIRSANLRLGIVTNGRADMQARKLAHLGLDALAEVVIISETAGVKKPDPKIFRDALSELDCPSENALFVGDNPELDVVGPAGVGMQSAWLTLNRDWPAKFDPPDYRITSLDDLRDVLQLSKPVRL